VNTPLFPPFASTWLAGAGFTGLLVCACVFDVRTRRIPNPLVAALLVTGFAYSVAQSTSVSTGLLHAGGGSFLGLALWLPFYGFRWMGAGDVKLFAAAGAWLGPMRTLEGALIAAFAGGVLAALWMLRTYGVAGTAVAASMSVRSPRTVVNHPVDAKSHRAIPYGVALSVGATLAAWFPDMLARVLNAAT